MQLIITKEGTFLELEDSVKMKANEFGVWFWEHFLSIDAKRIKNPIESNYTRVYEDFKGVRVVESKGLFD